MFGLRPFKKFFENFRCFFFKKKEKKDKKDKCSCSQKSFDYHGKENALIGKKGNFEVKSVVVVGTLSDEKIKEKINTKIIKIIINEC